MRRSIFQESEQFRARAWNVLAKFIREIMYPSMVLWPFNRHTVSQCGNLVFGAFIFIVSIGPVSAQFLSLSFEDQVEDHVGKVDLVALTLTFNEASGEYEVVLKANEDASFVGDFLIGINLFNGDLGTTALDPSYFHADKDVRGYDCPSLHYRISGVDPRLTQWSEGDRIAAAGPEPLGLPSGFSFFNTGLASEEDSTRADDTVGDDIVGVLERASGFSIYEVSPSASDDLFELQEDAGEQVFDLLANDCHPSLGAGSLEILSIETASISGTIEIRDQFLYYTPPSNYFGVETFEYVVSDAGGNTDTASVRIHVFSVNDQPIAEDDVFEINPRRSRHVLDVLANDSSGPDPHETLTLVEVDYDSSLGAVFIEENQLILETVGLFRGEAIIVYSVSDGNGGLAEAQAQIKIDQPNQDPTAVDDFVEGFEDSVLVVDVLANDTSAPDEGEVLFIESVGKSHIQASVSVRSGKVYYEPPLDFFGSDVFTYQIGDGFGGVSQASVHVTIENTNDPPRIENDLFEIVSNGYPYYLKPLLNDSSDPDPTEVLVLSDLQYSGESARLSVEENTVVVKPNHGFVGSLEFEYSVSDQSGGEAVGIASVIVRDANFPPIANSDVVRINLDEESVVIDVLVNDTTAPDQDEALTVISTIGTGIPGSRISHDGERVFFQAKEGFESGWFRYIVSDGNGGQDSAVVVVTASPVIESPAANDDFEVVPEDQESILNVIHNDLIAPELAGEVAYKIINGPLNGNASFDDQGMIAYQPSQDFYGRDSIHYLITYPSGTSSFAELLIEVKNTNDRPVAVDDIYEMLEDGGVIRLDILANDSSGPDPNETLSLYAAKPSENDGEVTMDGNEILYRPAENFSGQDSFLYSIRDSGGQLSEARVSLEIVAVNDPPTAISDVIEIDQGTERIRVNVLSNDTAFPDKEERLRVFSVTQGAHGGEVLIEDHEVFYSPIPRFTGVDRFEYSIEDGNGGVSRATVTVNVLPVAQVPEGEGDEFVISEDAERVRLDVLSNDRSGSVSGEEMVILSSDHSADQGELEIQSNALIFTPVPNFFGTVSFSYRIGVGELRSESIPVTITVTSVNDPPLLVDDTVLLEDPIGPVIIDVLANDSSGVDLNETLTILSAENGSAGGLVEVAGGKIVYVPGITFSGEEHFKYEASDGNGSVRSATVSIRVNRIDRIVPVVLCHDIELTLPESGDLILDADFFDDGSYDESGGLVLSVEPDRIDAQDVGEHEVVITGTDRSGNISSCVARLTIVDPDREFVDLLYPATRTVFRVSEDYEFNASDVPIEVGFVGDFDSIEILGDGASLATFSVTPGQSSVLWIWEEVRWGDHEIVVVGHKTSGATVNSIRAQISVSELASYVAMAVPAELDSSHNLDLIAEYLFEMGVNLEVFEEPLPLDFSDQEWDTVIWNGGARQQASEGSVAIFEELIQRGIGLYFMGAGILSEQENRPGFEESWRQLTLMTAAGQQAKSGPVALLKEGDERLLKGRFGTLTPFTLNHLRGGRLIDASADGLLQLDGQDFAASLEMARTTSGEGARRFVQIFSLNQPEDVHQTKTLFQNAVCWLLPDCFDCVNADLPPVVQGQVPDPILGQVMSVALLLANNGACEVSGAEIGVSGKGIDVAELLIDGESVPLSLDPASGYWRGPIGRVGKGTESAITAQWSLRVIDPALKGLSFETFSNNTPRAIVDVPIQVVKMEVIARERGALFLTIEAGARQEFEVEHANNLQQPIRWTRISQALVTDDAGNASLELEKGHSSRFYRISSMKK